MTVVKYSVMIEVGLTQITAPPRSSLKSLVTGWARRRGRYYRARKSSGEIAISNSIGLPETVRYGNSLPQTLYHYERELNETLSRVGAEAVADARVASIEGLQVAEKLWRLWSTIRFPGRFLDQSMDPFLQLWPSLGLFESLLWRSNQANSAIIYHDPVPLRRQFGYGGIARAAVRLSRNGTLPLIVTHSADADAELVQSFPAHNRVSVAHPILSLQETGERDGEDILVAGQFKPVRDLEILAALGPALRKRGFRPRIVGRGWPADIQGWDVHSLFVAEEDLSERLSAARVVVVPYKRYFQSGIAVRALEMGTVSVTPATSFARDLFGTDSAAIVHRPDEVEDWLRAIDAVSSGKVEAETTFDSYIERCDISWRALLNRLGTSRLV